MGTLGSAEFSGWVGGDLEVPPDEYFEDEDEASKKVVERGERWSKWIEIVHKCSNFKELNFSLYKVTIHNVKNLLLT